MKFTVTLLVCAALACLAGCGRKTKEISELQRKQAASLASEAQFALTLRDYARAEPLFAQATELSPDSGEYWLNLGATRVRLGNKSGAKAAYEAAREVYRDAYEAESTNSEPLLQEIYVLALLGRADEARKMLDKAAKQQPNDRAVRMFVEGRQLDRILEDPTFKEVAL